MFSILGATGHVGSAFADQLGLPVTVVTRDKGKAALWRPKGADAAVVYVMNDHG